MQYPVDPYLPEIAKALTSHPSTLLKAEPGAGKTTQVPLYLLQHFKRILVIEPRRLAGQAFCGMGSPAERGGWGRIGRLPNPYGQS